MKAEVRRCEVCEKASADLARLGICGWCGHEPGFRSKAVTHTEVAAAVADYLRQGGQIQCLPDQPTPVRPAIRVEEDVNAGVHVIPESERAA